MKTLIEKAQEVLGIELANFDFNGSFHRYGDKKELWAVGVEISNMKGSIGFINCGNFKKGTTYKFNSLGDLPEKSWPKKLRDAKAIAESKLKLEREEAYKQCIATWEPIWRKSEPQMHPYLVEKGLSSPFNSRTSGNLLLVPIYNIHKELLGFQKIYPKDGIFFKVFATGSKCKGGFCFLDPKKSRKTIYIAEGFATAASIQEALPEFSVVCAFNSGNLPYVLDCLRALFPDSKLIIAADKDSNGVGEKKAKEAVEGVTGAIYILPCFKLNQRLTDFNDLHVTESLEEVRRQLLIDENTFAERDFSTDILKGFIKEVGERRYKDHDRLQQYYHYVYKYKVIAKDGRIFIFDGVMYSETSSLEIKAFAQNHFEASGEFVSSRDVNEFYALITRFNHINNFESSYSASGEYLNFKNGVLELLTGKLLPHDPKYLFNYVIPHSYDSSAECPTWDKMLQNFTLGRMDLVQIIEEFLGFAMSNMDYVQFPKALVLDGDGENGKTTLVNAFKLVLGHENVTSTMISSINENRFMSSSLFGSLMNVSEEEKSSVFKETDNFKRLTGGSPVTAEKKGKDAFQFVNRAKLVMTYNKMPYIADHSHGMYRRLLIIPCELNLMERPDLRMSHLEQKLTIEVPGIINRAIRGLQALRTNMAFTTSEASKARLDETFKESNNLLNWWEDRIQITANPDNKETTDVLYGDFLSEVGPIPIPSKIKFAKELKLLVNNLIRKNPGIFYGQIRIGSQSCKGISGIRLNR